MNEINKLSEELKKAKDAYYNLEPIMSDKEYDDKLDLLKKLSPDNEEVFNIGAKPSTGSPWEKVKHEILMGSLDKVNSEEEFKNWVKKSNCDMFSITHKIDGASLEIIYENGDIQKTLTRGDGIIGEDITVNMLNIPSIPHKISNIQKTVIRGEVVMLKRVFDEKYSDKYANPRNTASAKMREKKNNGEDSKNLNFYAYHIECENKPKSMKESFDYITSLGFNVPELITGSIQTVIDKFNTVSKNRDNIEYEIDGMVISITDIDKLESLGHLNMRPRGQIAWKFDSEKSESKMIDVVWQVGPTGRVCPVAKIEPVKIGGVTIESVSLHNIKMFKELNLWKGCRVLVERRNDVIPYISSNLDDLK